MRNRKALALAWALGVGCGSGGGGGDGDGDGDGDADATASVDAPSDPGGEVFVTSRVTSALMVYPENSSGSPTPRRTLSGGYTGMVQPTDVAVAPGRGELFVASNGSDTVSVHLIDDDGNVPPQRTLGGLATGITFSSDFFAGITIDDLDGELYVVSEGPPTHVSAFAIDADGDTAPLRTISGPATLMTLVRDVAISPVTGEIVVLDSPPVAEGVSFGRVLIWDRDADGDVAPKRWFQTNVGNPRSLQVDTVNGEIIVLNGPCDCTSEVHAISAGTPTGGSGAKLREYQLAAYGSYFHAGASELGIADGTGYRVVAPSDGTSLRTVTVGGGTAQCHGVAYRPGT